MNERTIDLSPYLVSGTINNSVKGETTGELVINGIDSPLILDLRGNSQPDLAGCILKFTCPKSRPVEADLVELLVREQSGCVGIISAAERCETFENDVSGFSNLLTIEWFNLSTLIQFVGYAVGAEMIVDLPAWTLTKVEKEIQKQEYDAARAVFEGLWDEFENDLIESEESEEYFRIIDSILPDLEAVESDEERIFLLRQALGPDVSEDELWDINYIYFSPEEEDMVMEEGPAVETIPLDPTLKTLGNRLKEASKVLLYGAEKEGAPGELVDLGNRISNSMYLMLCASAFLDPNPETPGIEPYSILEQLEMHAQRCEAVISYLEIKGTAQEKKYCDQVWEIRKMIADLSADLNKKKPDQPPPDLCDDDIPF